MKRVGISFSHAAFRLTAISAVVVYGAGAAVLPEHVRASVQLRVDSGKSVSIVIGLVDAESTTYYGYGKTAADGHQVDKNTVYEIGSITKTFTAALLADMARRGEVSLDAPISTVLPPELKLSKRTGAITLQQLSSQVSGLPRLPNNMHPADMTNPYADYSVDQLYACLESVNLKSKPGAAYLYSNLGVGLLGQLLCDAADRDFESLMRARICGPLLMPDTRATLTADMAARAAVGHTPDGPTPHWDNPTLAGAGALYSTAKDMVRYLEANLGLYESPLFPALEDTHTPRANAGDRNTRIGLGWHMVSAPSGREIVWHNGGTGGYRCFAGFTPDNRTGVVVLTNTASEMSDDLGFHILDATLPLVRVVEKSPIELTKHALRGFEGRYEAPPQKSYEVKRSGNRLRIRNAKEPWALIYPESESSFYYEDIDATVSFTRDGDGMVSGFILNSSGMQTTATRVNP